MYHVRLAFDRRVLTIAGSAEDGAGGRLKFPPSDDQRRGREVQHVNFEDRIHLGGR